MISDYSSNAVSNLLPRQQVGRNVPWWRFEGVGDAPAQLF